MFQYCAIVVLLLAAFPAVRSQSCPSDPENPCTTTCNNTKISIANAIPYPQNITVTKYFYEFSCSGTTCGSGRTGIAVCQDDHGSTNKDKYSCGLITQAMWTITSMEPLEFFIIYSGGDPGSGSVDRTAKINFVTGNEVNFSFIGGTSQYEFKATAPAGSYSPSPSGGDDIAGAIGLVIIFLSIAAFIAYFVIGGLVMYFHKGARGVEVIPNLTFWKDFPFLLKDAGFFIISPCYKRASYDKI